MLREYVEQILSLYNYVDGLVVTDKKGYIEYYLSYRPDLSQLKDREIRGKHILEVYPELKEENSSIMKVLKTGVPIYNEYQHLKTYKNELIYVVNTTMPIILDGKIAGAIDVSRYVDADFQRQNIKISLNENRLEKWTYSLDDIITQSQAMENMKHKIPMIAQTDSSVLIYGETGTGKEMVAQSIHACSNRSNKRFISQNCAAIPVNLLEGILFGTTKGSYTGAENKPGLFEIANGGTLFLDEINSMELSVQSKILKAIEEKQVTRLGGVEPIKFDVKIISAMNVEPMKCMQEKKIREDLFYRLSVVQVNIPPLRERREDIPLLTEYFINYYNHKMHRNILSVDEEVEEIFNNHTWKGNVRELKNVMEGAFNIESGRIIRRKDLPDYMTKTTMLLGNNEEVYSALRNINLKDDFSLDKEVANFEKQIIENVIEGTSNLAEASRILGISRQSLNYKLTKYHFK